MVQTLGAAPASQPSLSHPIIIRHALGYVDLGCNGQSNRSVSSSHLVDQPALSHPTHWLPLADLPSVDAYSLATELSASNRLPHTMAAVLDGHPVLGQRVLALPKYILSG